MKTCPTCKSVYADDSLNFCLDDGTVLFDGDGSAPTVFIPNRVTDESLTEIPTQVSRIPNLSAPQHPRPTASSFPPTFQSAPQFSSASKPADSNYKYLAIIAGTLFFGVIGGLLIAVGLGKWTGGENSTTNNTRISNSISNVANNSARTLLSNSANNSANSSLSNANALVTNANANQTSAPKFSLIGTWKGKFGSGDTPSTLNIRNQNNKTFSGTLNTEDGYIIEFTGEINYEKLTVSMQETKVIKNSKGGIWSLGKNDGVISANGKSMEGKGKDKNASYPWSFKKE